MATSMGPSVIPFSPLPDSRTPWTEFVFSSAVQALAVMLLFWVQLLHPEIISAPEHTYRSVELVPTPVPVNHQPQPVRHLPPPMVAQLDPPAEVLHLPAAAPKPKPNVADAPAPEVKIAEKKLDSLLPASKVVIPKQGVKTNVFSTGSSATPTMALAPDKVQTGGFGDPNGVPARGTEGRAINIAQSGSFDLPAGPGYGNGTGGAKGARGVVASAGFGNGVAIADGSAHNSTRGTVRQGGFGDADVPAPATVHSRPLEAAIRVVPAEIISKPLPIYTEEARHLKVEGEVLLEVVLAASGKLHVVRVVHGLGHGLDDAAVKAAEQIQFKPALQDGRPADSTAVLHIIFQLA
jgi:TonB family protein